MFLFGRSTRSSLFISICGAAERAAAPGGGRVPASARLALLASRGDHRRRPRGGARGGRGALARARGESLLDAAARRDAGARVPGADRCAAGAALAGAPDRRRRAASAHPQRPPRRRRRRPAAPHLPGARLLRRAGGAGRGQRLPFPADAVHGAAGVARRPRLPPLDQPLRRVPRPPSDGVPLVFSNSSPRLRAVNKLPPAWGVGASDALAAAAVAARSAAGDAHLSRGAALPLPQLTNNCGNSWGVSAPPKTWSPDGAAARAAAALARAGIDPFGEGDGRRVVVVNGQAGEFALPKGVSPLPPPRHEDRSEAAAAAGWAAAAAAAGMPQPRGGGRTAGGHQQNRRVGAAAPAASWEVRPRWPQPNASHAPVRGVTAQLNPKSARGGGDGGSEHVPKALLQAPARRRKGKGKAKGGGGGKLSARVHRPPMPAHAVSAWHSAQGESA